MILGFHLSNKALRALFLVKVVAIIAFIVCFNNNNSFTSQNEPAQQNSFFNARTTTTRRRYIILTNPRCGSTLLVHLLAKHPHVNSLNEPIDPFRDASLLRLSKPELFRLVTRTLTSTAQSHHRVSGLKLVFAQLKVLNVSFEEIRDEIVLADGRLILLYRENLFEQYVSFQLAQRTNEWTSIDEKRGKTSGADGDEAKIALNWGQFVEYCNRQRQYWTQFKQFLKQTTIEHVSLSYDELSKNTSATMASLYRFLQVDATLVTDFATALEKQSERYGNDYFNKVIQNYKLIETLHLNSSKESIYLKFSQL